jgi:type IV pilus assembly protein PilM
MLNSKSFLSLDFGAGSLKLAEFELTEDGALRLRQFGLKPLGLEGSQDSVREKALLKAIQELAVERPFSAKNINVCAPGYHTFSKFVKLPPVDASKVTQIIQYEAQQNVPFPLEEVVWDYQIIGTTPTGELEVFLVAIKGDIVEGMFRTADTAGLRLQLVDVSPAALCNAFRYNYGDLEGCSMLLDIGAKTSNVLFFEKGKYSSRGINIGANSITQDFAAEAKMPFAAAEKFKISDGFVSLGGAYEEPDNPRQAQISKIARQVMTRLHIQVNQTKQFYRGQQGGAEPQRLFLAGGASIMPYTAQFFSEKLNIPVEYFNPLRNVQIDPSVNLEDLAKVAHSSGEVVGLGLRNLAECPIELNLVPRSIRQRQKFNQKKPFFIATAASLVLGLFAIGWFFDQKVLAVKNEQIKEIDRPLTKLQQDDANLQKELAARNKVKEQLDQFTAWSQDRFFWADMLRDLRASLIETEKRMETTLKEPAGVWIEKFAPVTPELDAPTVTESGGESTFNMNMRDPRFMARYGKFMVASQAATPDAGAAPAPTNEISSIKVSCRAVNLGKVAADANDRLAYDFLERVKALTNYFLPSETVLGGKPVVEASADTYTFDVTLKLKQPIKF